MAFPKPPRGSAGLTSGSRGSSGFTEQFNRLVGNRTGRPVGTRQAATPQRRSATKQRLRKGARGRGASVSMGTSKLPKSVERSRQAWFGNRGDPDSGIGFERQLKSNLEGIYDDLTTKFLRYENEQEQVQQEFVAKSQGVEAADLMAPQADYDRNDPIAKWNAEHPDEAPMQLATPFTETWAGSPVGRTLDIINRPFYGVNEGIRNIIEEEASRNNGGTGSDWSAFTDLTSGFWEGLSGKKKTTPGEIYETFKNEAEHGQFLRTLEEEHPFIEEQISRGVGLAGELTLDPTNFISPGRARIIKETGEVAGPSTMRTASGAIADRAVNDFVDTVVNTRRAGQMNVPARDVFVTHGQVNMLDSLANSELNIMGGGRRGTYQVMNGASWAQTAANSVVNGQKKLYFQAFNNHIDSFWKSIHSGKPMPRQAVEAYIAIDPDFARLIDDLDTDLVNRGRLAPNGSIDDLMAAVGKQDRKRIADIADNIRNELDADLQKVHDDVYEATRNATYSTMGIRVGKKVIPVKSTGRAYNAIAQKVRKATDEVPGRSFEAMFPSILSLRAQKRKAVGAEAFQDFKNKTQEIARQFTKDEAEIIHFSIENGTDLTADIRLQQGKDYVVNAYKEMFDKEVAAGARPDLDSSQAGQHLLNNYVYVYNKKGSLNARKEFKDKRKGEVYSSKGSSRGRFGTKEAQSKGLKPVTNAFEALMYRNLKSQRDQTRSLFRSDLIENYGFWANNMGEFTKANRKITRISPDKLPQHLRQEIKKNGGGYFLPYYHADLASKFDEMMSWNSASMGRFMREWNKIIGTIKAAQTIPAPGFHINNMIGDAFMGLMDGVNAKDYAEMTAKAARAALGERPMVRLAPGIEESIQELWSRYQRDASGGYYNIEHGNYVKPSTKSVAGRAVRGVQNAVVEVSEMREDMGRFTHYVHALKEEANLRYKSGMRDPDLILNQARDAAMWRVNYYRFDYNALTIWERKLKTIGIPFYTFTRKVIPVLLASMYENPKYINLTSRFFMNNDGSAAEEFSNWNVPSYLRMGGAAFLNDDEEPWVASMGGLPLGKLNMLQGGEAATWNPQDPQFLRGLAKTFTEQLNMPMQIPFELSMGKENFNQDIIQTGSEWDYLLNKIPLVKDIRTEGNTVPGLRNIIPGEDQAFDPSSLIYNRLAGAGLQVRPLRRGQQAQAHETWMDELIEDPMYKINNSQDIYRIVPSNQPGVNGMSFEIRSNLELDEQGNPAVIRSFDTVAEATAFIKKNLPKDYKKPDEFLELGPEGTARYTDPNRYIQQP